MVEIKLSVATIDANHLLPVVEVKGALVVFDQLELIRESPSDHKLVLAASIVTSDFLCDQSLEILVQRDTLDKTINLSAVRENFNLTFAVENSLLTTFTEHVEFVVVNE